ncbi:MAG: hypothetical protein K2N73_03310, partial [Lachnospiraceae bacterium]|nr:hypothetical protein [Lachnospiraceae bacterium]
MNNSIIYRPLTATPFKRNSFIRKFPLLKNCNPTSDVFGEQKIHLYKSGFADENIKLSLFFKAFQVSYSELICIFPCFCPYGQFTRESFSE